MNSSSSSLQQQKRIKIPPHAVRLRLELRKSSRVDTNLKKACIKSLLLHILYSRSVIPYPADEILQKYDQQSVDQESEWNGDLTNKPQQQKRRTTAKERKIRKHAHQLRSVLKDIEQILNQISHLESQSCPSLRAVLITLGPSLISPREQYLIRFPSWPTPQVEINNDMKSTSSSNNKPILPNTHRGSQQEQEQRQQNLSQQQSHLTQKQKRMEQEISRRSVQDFMRGTIQNRMFEARGGGGSGGDGGGGNNHTSAYARNQSNLKVNIALLMTNDAIQLLFDSMVSPSTIRSMSRLNNNDGNHQLQNKENFNHDQEHMDDTNGDSSSSWELRTIRNRVTIRHNLDIKVPRMVSKRLNLHRPYVVFDVVPMVKPMELDDEDNDSTRGDAITEAQNSGRFQDNNRGVEFDDCDDTWITLRSFIKGFRI